MTPAPDALRARTRRARAAASLSLICGLAVAAAAQDLPQPSPAAPSAQPAPPVLEAREISVTATRGERNVLDVPAHVSVIDRAAIESSGASDLPELLRREAGVEVANTTTNAEGYSVEMRGFLNGGGNGCRTLVRVDGRRVNEADSGCVDWTFLPLEQIERVEVVRGAGSTAYGDNALAGVIEITTRAASAEPRTLASLRFEQASFDSERYDGTLSQRLGGLRVAASAHFDDTDGYRDRADLNDQVFALDLDYDLGERGRIGLGGGYGSSERSRPGTVAPGQDREDASPNLDSGHERERYLDGVLELALPWQLALHATPYYRHSEAQNRFEDPDPVFGFVFDSAVETDAGGLDAQLTREFDWAGHSIRVVAGAELRQDEIDAESTFAVNDAQRQLWGVFVQAEAWVAEDVLVTAALRRDRSDLEGKSTSAPGRHFNAEQGIWSPRAAITWRFHEHASAYVAYARGFRFPNLDETFGSFGFAPGLDPERANSFEGGATWRSETLELRGTLYTMRVEDEIFFDPLAPPFGLNDNLDRVRHRGFELSARTHIRAWLEAFGSYTWDDVEVLEDAVPALEGEPLPLTPRNRGDLGLAATLPYGLAASLRALFVGERRLVNDVAGAASPLDDYFTLDARVAWTRALPHGVALTLEGIGRNLTDQRYAEVGGFSTFSGGVGLYPAPERNFAIGLRVSVER